MQTEEMVESVKASVLFLEESGSVGTGFVMSTSGHVLTCHHVVSGNSMNGVLATGEAARLELLARDSSCDLAILSGAASSTPPLRFADPLSIREGQTVYAVGHPHGLGFTISRGVVSSCNRTMNGIDFIQTDVSLNPGNSGGPIVNEDGEVVAIATGVVTESQGLGFGLALRYVFAFTAQLRLTVERASLLRPAAEVSSSEQEDRESESDSQSSPAD